MNWFLKRLGESSSLGGVGMAVAGVNQLATAPVTSQNVITSLALIFGGALAFLKPEAANVVQNAVMTIGQAAEQQNASNSQKGGK